MNKYIILLSAFKSRTMCGSSGMRLNFFFFFTTFEMLLTQKCVCVLAAGQFPPEESVCFTGGLGCLPQQEVRDPFYCSYTHTYT